MKNLVHEIDANYQVFASSWHAEMAAVYSSLQTQNTKFLGCYRRLVSLQAWRSELLESTISADALGFFLEAQNDGLVSLVLACLGSRRAALQSLRSCLENVLYTAYYMDHPVELKLWHAGKHRLAYNQLESYFAAHPSLAATPIATHSLGILSSEYSTLSRAVHGTATSFRMSADDGVHLWSKEPAAAGMYETRHKALLGAINQLLLCIFREHIQGASRINLRKSVSIAIPRTRHAKIKSEIGITLFAP